MITLACAHLVKIVTRKYFLQTMKLFRITLILLCFNCCNLEIIPDEVVGGSISVLNCSDATASGTLISGQAATNITVSVPYTGGDGGTHSGQTVLSTGVTGLTAKLDAGSFDIGSGILDYAVSGTPSASGNAIFALNIGGKTCLLSVPVQALIGSITGLNCSGATTNGALYVNQAASNVSVAVPYTGGNGGAYTGQSVTSTGVTGLTATLSDSIFTNGDGNLVYQITGTPAASGTASFALNVGGKSCTLAVTVGISTGSIGSLNCGSATNSGTLVSGVAASNVTVSVPYTGGNGGTHGGQTVQSTGVTGLEAMLSSGSFDNGNGNVVYMISGTPSINGTASFALNIGGKNCTVAVPVNVGSIGNLDCQNIALSGTLTAGQAVNNVTVTVPYTGGNGGKHTGQTVNSSTPGVLGLTATLDSGSFSSGSGTLVYTITGTPSTSGAAMFALNIGGKMCTISLTVQAAAGTINALNCSNATVAGTLIAGVTAGNVTVTVPYTGGNGGTHGGQTVQSTGVTGLEAMLSAGSFDNGSGAVVYTITGNPFSAGTATFVLNIGGKTCDLTVQVNGGSIGNLDCQNITVSGTLIAGQAANSVTVSVPYTGGNGGKHTGQIVNSSTPGVLGLTATLGSGSFTSGSGTLVYNISGTPTTSGSAMFALNIGGAMCGLTLPVVAGSISALDCSNANLTSTLTAGVAASGVSVSVPYTGGNGGSHGGQTVSSTGVTGLVATLLASSFASGIGNLDYSISGMPSAAGTAIFALNIGGKTCILSVTVYGRCNAKISDTEIKTFMCHNLGSANSTADPFTPSWEISGAYWQWGRLVQAAAGPDGPGSGQANNGTISGWNTTSASNLSWLDASKTANDPCPSGFRVPTKAQWDGVIANNTKTNVGTWSISATNYSSGKKFGNNLFLPAAGDRSSGNGALSGRGNYGGYWSSTEYGLFNAWFLNFNSSIVVTSDNKRTTGRSVRCISE